MKRKFFSFLLMLLPMMASADAVEINGIWYNLISKAKQAEVTSKPSGYYSGSIEIPEKVVYDYDGSEYSVTSIGNNAFYFCNSLTSITIPNSVTSIGSYAFYCSGLTSITIPNNVTSIGNTAFGNCSSLTSITIPNNISSIASSAFANCSNLTSITIPNNLTSIGSAVFSNCSGLTSIMIPNSVTSIDVSAFSGCSGLTSITIPNTVTSIGSTAFRGCTGLTSITIGNSVKTIWSNAFAQCPNLTDVYCTVEKLSSTNYGGQGLYTYTDAFDGSYINYAKLHVPASALNSYMTTEPWSGFGEVVTISGEEMPKCATPTISFEGEKIKFSCETEGVEFVSEVSSVDAGNKYTAEVNITGKITVKVYATKSGCVNSDTATAVIEVPGELKGDLNNDGTVNVADHVELTKIIMHEE